MRSAALAVVVVIGLFAGVAGGRTGEQGRDAKGELIALSALTPSQQQIVVIDPRTRAMSVYHIDLNSGGVSFKSARNIGWDLQLEDFNGNEPLPSEIRSLLEQR